jgi:hypothetical protein
MLQALGGGNKNDPSKYYGKTIKSISFKDDAVRIWFDDGLSIRISDEGQSCCEYRYMDTPDNVADLVGQKLLGIEQSDFSYDGSDCDTHEMVFLNIKTDKEVVQFSFHNEHNGYYGGFSLQISEIK